MCAWLGARHLAAAWPTTTSRRSRCGERSCISCIFYCLFAFGRQLVAASANLHRARSLRIVLDGGNRRLLGWTGSAGCRRPPLAEPVRSRRPRGWPPARTPALALVGAGGSGDGDHGCGGCFHCTGRYDRQNAQIPEGPREILARGLAGRAGAQTVSRDQYRLPCRLAISWLRFLLYVRI